MTAQHVPSTPMWRRVLSLPKTAYGWWAIGLAGPGWVFWVFAIVSTVLPGAGVLDSDPPGLLMAFIIASQFAGLAGGFVAAIALLGGHERSWLVWVAMVPMLLVFSLWISILTSLLSANLVVAFSLAFLIVVLMVAGIAFWISRVNSREPR